MVEVISVIGSLRKSKQVKQDFSEVLRFIIFLRNLYFDDNRKKDIISNITI